MRSGMTLLEVLVVASLLAVMAGLALGTAKPSKTGGSVGSITAWQWLLRDTAREHGGCVLERGTDGWRIRTATGALTDLALLPPPGCELLGPTGEAEVAVMFDADGFSTPFTCRLPGTAAPLPIDPLTGAVVATTESP